MSDNFLSALKGRNIDCRSEWDLQLGGSVVSDKEELIENADKCLLLWTPQLVTCYKHYQNVAMRKESAHQPDEDCCGHFRKFDFDKILIETLQIDKAMGNFVIHVVVDRSIDLSHALKWETPVYIEDMGTVITRIHESELEQKDLSPCGDVATGLVWGFLISYLKHVLAGFSRAVEENWQKQTDTAGVQLCNKLLIVLPRSGKVLSAIPGCRHCGQSEQKKNVGSQERTFKTSLYEITDPNTGQKYHCGVEYCTPVRSMYQMMTGFKDTHNPSLGGMSRVWLEKQVAMFRTLMENKLTSIPRFSDLADNVHFIELDDTDIALLGAEDYEARVGPLLVNELLTAVQQYTLVQSFQTLAI